MNDKQHNMRGEKPDELPPSAQSKRKQRLRHGVIIGANLFAMSCVLFATIIIGGFNALEKHFGPPSLERDNDLSPIVLDKEDRLLRAYTTQTGRWRLPVTLDAIDPNYIKLLLNYEDRRFENHYGVDIFAMMRASWQLLTNQRIISGGSTLSMQLARLVEGYQGRSFNIKLMQIFRAIQIEQRLSKNEILARYLTRAPYGGNIEGVRAAALTYFGKEPRRLSLAESALLVALPQSPEARRPDRHHRRAKRARKRVLQRALKAGLISQADFDRAVKAAIPTQRIPFAKLAAHLSDQQIKAHPGRRTHRLTIDRDLQAALEKLTLSHVRRKGKRLSAAIMVIEHKTGQVRAHIGSASYLDASRFGAIDMTQAMRSPGSTLKPFIYGLGFERGLIHPNTLIEDKPTRFGDYAPENFDKVFRGTLTIREALQLSLNIPAVKVLAEIGPARLRAQFRHAGIKSPIPGNLTLALGGIGLRLSDLAALYTALARGGEPIALNHRRELSATGKQTQPKGGYKGLLRRKKSERPLLLSKSASWYVGNILSGTPPPKNAPRGRIAYKTGTSYGYRDAFAIGYDGRYVIAVWMGRPDGTATPNLMGVNAAAPLLFDAFAQANRQRSPLPLAPRGVLHASNAQLPPPLKHFRPDRPMVASRAPREKLKISFPPQNAEIELVGKDEPVALKAEGGKLPLIWLINGQPIATPHHKRISFWQPGAGEEGFAKLSVIDADGQADEVLIRLRPRFSRLRPSSFSRQSRLVGRLVEDK